MKNLKIELFAVNLQTPSHMEWTKDNKLLVSEHTAGKIKDITNGGDFKNMKSYASNLEGPSGILPLDNGKILIAEMWANRITDISAERHTIITDAKTPYSLAAANGRISVTERDGKYTLKITDITDIHNKHTIVEKIPFNFMPGLEGLTPLNSWPDKWMDSTIACTGWEDDDGPDPDEGNTILASCSMYGQIYSVPKERKDVKYLDLIEQEKNLLFTGLDWNGGMNYNKVSKKLYVTQPLKGTVMELDLEEAYKKSKPIDCRFVPPIIKGLNMPTCVRFSQDGKTMYVCSMPIGAVWKITNFF